MAAASSEARLIVKYFGAMVRAGTPVCTQSVEVASVKAATSGSARPLVLERPASVRQSFPDANSMASERMHMNRGGGGTYFEGYSRIMRSALASH